MDIESFIVYVKKEDIYKDVATDVETRFYSLNFELKKPLGKGKSKKVIGVMKNELGGQNMK